MSGSLTKRPCHDGSRLVARNRRLVAYHTYVQSKPWMTFSPQALPPGFPYRTRSCLHQPKPSLPKCLRCHRRDRDLSRHPNGSAQRALSAPGWHGRIRVAVKQVKPHRHVLVRNAQPGIDVRVPPSNRLLPASDPRLALGRRLPVLRPRDLCRIGSHDPNIGRAHCGRQLNPKPNDEKLG